MLIFKRQTQSTSTPRPSLRTRLAHFRSAREGVAAVEFAVILPVMLAMYLGMVEVTVGVTTNRKVTLLARTLADLTAQSAKLTNAERDNIFTAASYVMQPAPSTGVKMLIVSLYVDKNKTVKVCWGEQRGGIAIPSAVTLDEGLKIADTSLIMSRVEMPYSPAAKLLNSSYILKETSYMRPRLVTQVPRETSPGTEVICPVI
jgi:Flp pilus assembly protein TadG